MASRVAKFYFVEDPMNLCIYLNINFNASAKTVRFVKHLYVPTKNYGSNIQRLKELIFYNIPKYILFIPSNRYKNSFIEQEHNYSEK